MSELSPITNKLIDDFAEALKQKLREAQDRYGYHGDPWTRNDWEEECINCIWSHMRKGDPRDVAVYCAFLWYHDWNTSV